MFTATLDKINFNIINWVVLKRTSLILITTVFFHFKFPVESIFPEIDQASWRGDFYFVLYWVYLSALSLILFGALEVILFAGPFGPPKAKKLWSIMKEEEKRLLFQASEAGIIRLDKENDAAIVLEKMRFLKPALKHSDFTIWKITLPGKHLINTFQDECKKFQ